MTDITDHIAILITPNGQRHEIAWDDGQEAEAVKTLLLACVRSGLDAPTTLIACQQIIPIGLLEFVAVVQGVGAGEFDGALAEARTAGKERAA
ncbi:MAG: hypothetical protein ACHRHE_15200 [Tepidisphaerales bacterium]